MRYGAHVRPVLQGLMRASERVVDLLEGLFVSAVVENPHVLLDAPTRVDSEQLEELGISLTDPDGD